MKNKLRFNKINQNYKFLYVINIKWFIFLFDSVFNYPTLNDRIILHSKFKSLKLSIAYFHFYN